MIKTPTFYVFKLLQVHQDAQRLRTQLITEDYDYKGDRIPAITASASRNVDGKSHISLTNANPREGIALKIDLLGTQVNQVSGRQLTADAMDAHNTFENPDQVYDTAFTDYKLKSGVLELVLPPKSVVVLEIK